jgi:protein SCO1
MERKRIAEATKGVGRPKVGGEFTLVDHTGRVFGDGDMRGKYSLVCAPLSTLFVVKERSFG